VQPGERGRRERDGTDVEQGAEENQLEALCRRPGRTHCGRKR
jgi:hypothetical protein